MLRQPEVFVMEKIHGTGAKIVYAPGQQPVLRFLSGGEKHDRFVALFPGDLEQKIASAVVAWGFEEKLIEIFGEAYGGKQQGMAKTYGPELCFTVYDVRIRGHVWLGVVDAETFTGPMGLEFCPYWLVKTSIATLDAYRDQDSTLAQRRGMGPGHKMEGIIIRPLSEHNDEHGNRVIAKHKRAEFMERKTPKPVDISKLEVLKEAQAIADEWVTFNRLQHVIQQLTVNDVAPGIEQTGDVIRAMIHDVEQEAFKEIEPSQAARAAIGRTTAKMFKTYLQSQLQAA